MQQMIPPLVKTTVKKSKPRSCSQRRLICLVATAAAASGLGIALGSTVRFNALGIKEAAPLFKPQQDFPPLAQWPPKIPLEPSYGPAYNPSWEDDVEAPQQLADRDSVSRLDVAQARPEVTPEQSTTFPEIPPEAKDANVEDREPSIAPMAATLSSDGPLPADTNNLSPERLPEGLPPRDDMADDTTVETPEDVVVENPDVNDYQQPLWSEPESESGQPEPEQWFNKRPASEKPSGDDTFPAPGNPLENDLEPTSEEFDQ